jgi:predicted MPP superfamily phosphohydrolase
LLRDFVRNHVFERFPAVFGASIGGAAVVLSAWVVALAAGPGAVASFGWLACALAASAIGAGAHPALLRLARHHGWASAAEPVVFAAGFGLVVIAAVVVTSHDVLTVAAALLAALGLPAPAGAWLLQAGSTAGAAVAAGALAWGYASQGGALELTQHRVEIDGLPAALAGLRVAHLSDLHIGNGMEGARLERLVDRTNALRADLIVITGDLFDNDAEVMSDGAAVLARLAAPLGVFAVLGNHDGFVGADDVAAALAANAPKLELLRGRVASVAAPAPLYVAGFDDPGHDWQSGGELPELEALGAARPADGPTLLLMHRPDAFPRAAALGFALVLSGHFHGGQVALPIAGGRFNAARLLTRFDRGAHREAGALLYVSRGIGFAGPRLRFASPPEIAVHELWPKGATARDLDTP